MIDSNVKAEVDELEDNHIHRQGKSHNQTQREHSSVAPHFDKKRSMKSTDHELGRGESAKGMFEEVHG